MRNALFLIAVGISWALTASSPLAQDSGRQIVIEENADYFGNDLRAERNVSLDECKRLCLDENQCRAFTYNTSAQWCFLKSDFGELNRFEGAVAGRVVEVASAPDIGAPPPLDFLPSGTAEEAGSFRREALAAAASQPGPSAAELQSQAFAALDAGNAEQAERLLKAAAGKQPDNGKGWFAVALAALQKNNGDWRIRRLALHSAVNAYRLTRTAGTRAGALGALARALELQGQFRPALTAYSRSLELVDSPELAAAYRDLRRREGFRVTGNTVDADTARPRVCVQFSEPLVNRGVDYSQFITVDGRPAAIDVEDRQICATGLEHGNNYRVALRAGLPSTVDEVLQEPVVVNAYIRDRAPSVRFSGETFVLPRQARQGIPVFGVNADSAELQLYRIGERSLSRVVSGGEFLNQLGGYDIERVRDEVGRPVWEGTLQLQRERNREVATSFPVNEVLEDREPGIYVLTAVAAGAEDEFWAAKATQWFLVSDLGLTTHAGADGLNVFVRSLDSARAVDNVELTLIARNNEILGTSTTGEDGRARFEPGLMRGSAGMTPSVLTARLAGGEGAEDFVFLDLTRAGFDLSDRGVTGRPAPGAIDVYAWTERGIYRPGESVNAVALGRDDGGEALGGLPLTVTFRRPDGVVAQQQVSSSPSAGGHESRFEIPANAMHGVWRMEVHADPDEPALAEKQFLVEDFVPDRIEFDLSADRDRIAQGQPLTVEVDGRYLYGAPADDLAIEADLRIATTREFEEYPGYRFGFADEEEPGPSLTPLSGLPRTDSEGRASFEVVLGSLPSSTRPFEASVIVRLREDGGQAVERQLVRPVRSDTPLVGIKPAFDGALEENSTAGFDVIALDGSGEVAEAETLEWSLYRIERNFQWYQAGNSWRYEAVEIPRLVGSGSLETGTTGRAAISSPVEWGRYRLEVEAPGMDGAVASVNFDAGYFASGNPAETPDALQVSLDKENYTPGETASLAVDTQDGGVALVAIGSDRLHESLEAEIPAGGGRVDIPTREEWGAGAYVTVTLFRAGEERQGRAPSRAIGTAWLQLEPGDRQLEVSLDLPEMTSPDQALSVPVRIGNLEPGEEAYITLAAVDVGILNLTRYEAPDPAGWYFGQRRLGIEIRDIYGRLIDGSLGERGQVRSGGDGPGMAAEGSPPTERLLSLYSGIVRVGEDGVAEVGFDLPPFNGTARFMAVAWTGSAVGAANADVVIRDPVVLSASLPKVMAPGDRAETLVEIANTDGPAGDYELTISADDRVRISGFPELVRLAEGERRVLPVNVEALKSGTARIEITARHDAMETIRKSRQFTVRPSTLPVALRSEFQLAAGRSVTIDDAILSQSLREGASVSLTVSQSAGFDVNSLLMKLDRFPYGCAEQTTSRALPLLYLSEFELPEELHRDDEVAERVEKAVKRVLSFQSASGGFGLWGPDDREFWLDAYITDFLTRASETGHDVPETAMRLALNNLQNKLGYQNELPENGSALAYALYVLARNREASAGDLRYYADTRLDEFETPLARAQLAAALSLYNEMERSNRAFSSALRLAESGTGPDRSRSDYGTPLRDGAAMLALASESRPAPTPLAGIIGFVEGRVASASENTSTQENAWMVLAARAVAEGNRALQLEVDGARRDGAVSMRLDGEALAANPVTVRNAGDEPVSAVVTALASPFEPLPAGGEGFAIERRYYTLDGEPASMIEVQQNRRFVVVIDVTEFTEGVSRVLVSDLLPGGLEIDNPRLVDSATLDNFEWLGETDAAHLEFRDDRFVAAFNRRPDSPRSVRMAYVVRAVTPGRYAHPAASVEDMYRPQLSARTSSGFLEIVPGE